MEQLPRNWKVAKGAKEQVLSLPDAAMLPARDSSTTNTPASKTFSQLLQPATTWSTDPVRNQRRLPTICCG